MSRKIKFLDRRVKISDQEIESYMDFDVLMDKSIAHNLNNQVVKTLTRRFVYAISLLAVFGGTYWYYIASDNSTHIESKKESLDQEKPSVNEKNESAEKHDLADSMRVNKEETPIIIIQNEEETIDNTIGKKKEIVEKSVFEQKNEPLGQYIYKDAVPADGIEHLYEYFDLNLKYPVEALTDSIEGSVVVRFTILEDGRIDNIVIQKSLGEVFDIEAIRLIENMPTWKPATVNGVTVSSKLSIPLHFKVK